jgi:vitamin B12 transporter
MNGRAIQHVGATCALFASMFFCGGAVAQDAADVEESLPKIIIQGNRLKGTVKDIGAAVTVISEKEIAESGAVTVPEILRRQPGVDVVQSGPTGGNVSVFLRGANSEHTLIVVDGILMNNPVTPTRIFDLGTMTLDLVDHIEIIRGPQSSLYGSDALGGVISIVTKRGRGAMSSSIQLEGGSFGTGKALASVSGSEGDIDLSLSASRSHTDGVSAASVQDGNREKDGNDITTVAGQVGYAFSDQLSVRSTLRLNESATEIDNFGGVGGDDPNREVDNRTIAAGVVVEGSTSDEMIRPSVGFTISDHQLDDNNDPDLDHPIDSLQSNYDGTLMKGYTTIQIEPNERISSLIGFEAIEETASSSYRSVSFFGPYDEDLPEKSARTNGGFIQLRGKPFGGFVLEGSARVDDNQRFDRRATWRVTPQYLFEDSGTTLRANVGTGYKAPSLYQIFSPYGERDLMPERSTGWDLGIDQTFCEGEFQIGANYFQNKLSNLINFDPTTFRFQNIAEAKTKGVEVSSQWSPMQWESLRGFALSSSYTYTDPTDAVTGQQLLRRVRNKADFSASYRWGERYTALAGYTVVGRRVDLDFSGAAPSREYLGGYGLARLGLSANVTKSLTASLHLNNLFDKTYEEVNGYGTFGRGVFGGVQYQF